MIRTTARRSRQAFACAVSLAAIALAAAGCGGGYSSAGYYVSPVSAVYGPYWYPANYGTVTYVTYPWWGDPPPPPKNDPMVEDSPTHRAIAEQVHTAFSAKGYKTSSTNSDVDVTVYASARPGDLDISGYTHVYDFKNIPKLKDKTKYPKGTIIVDVLQPKTHVLLWRGTTSAPASDDVDKYQKDLRAAVDRIVEKYPKAKER